MTRVRTLGGFTFLPASPPHLQGWRGPKKKTSGLTRAHIRSEITQPELHIPQTRQQSIQDHFYQYNILTGATPGSTQNPPELATLMLLTTG